MMPGWEDEEGNVLDAETTSQSGQFLGWTIKSVDNGAKRVLKQHRAQYLLGHGAPIGAWLSGCLQSIV